MMTRRALFLAIAVGLLAAGCSSFSLRPVSPPRTTAVSSVEVVIDAAVDGKKRRILEKLRVPMHMEGALLQSFARGPGPSLRVTITSFRTGGFGPTRMHARVDMTSEAGEMSARPDADSTTSVGGNTTALTRRVSQDIVHKVVGQFP